uniref:ROK family protein n=1 Tax=Neorhizobium sp. EC2-8 TaxID=3129230 RepID=UPI0031017C9B
MICGGIDIGGTKIEARLFSDDLTTIELHRVSTPRDGLNSFMEALAGQIRWLEQQSRLGHTLPIGIALPGLIDPRTGLAFTSNLPASGHDIASLLTGFVGRRLPFMNDCQAFALSEANGGAGDGFDTVVGLIMGTGIGAGLSIAGKLTKRLNGSALEVGHVGVPARTLERLDLPLWRCGCGKIGCFEQYVSGSGLARLGTLRLGRSIQAEEIVASALGGEPESAAVMSQWAEIAAELLLLIQLTHDPDCIVIGGGLSRIAGIVELLETPFASARLGEMHMPAVRVAVHGDSSGGRGAALMATRLAR